MKIYSSGRSEIIEQAGRKSFHMGFDLNMEQFGISMEADLSLPTKSNRKISMMTSFNEELYNSADDFLSKIKIYDGDMKEFTDDMLVAVVTRMIHNAIQRLNKKGEPLWNIFVKTPKAKARELELTKEEYLGKPSVNDNVISKVEEISISNDSSDGGVISEVVVSEEKVVKIPVKKKKKTVKKFKDMETKSKIPSSIPKEKPFLNPNKVF